MGYKLAGFDVVGCCEIDPKMMKLYKANNKPKLAYLMDIRDMVKKLEYGTPQELRSLDILDGSPPCSVFSIAGERSKGWNVEKTFREGQRKQRLDDLFFYFLEVARILRPKVIVAENVKGLISGNARGWVHEIVKVFKDIGYDLQIFLFNSATMGVPQKRERVFFIARREDLGLPKLEMRFDQEPILFKDVREEHGKPIKKDSQYAKLLKYRRPSDRCIADINQRITRKSGGFSVPINHDNEPTQTITAGGSLLRYCDGLKMSDRDIINCQTFPQDYDFMDQKVQYVCGMSVPPVMMANIASSFYGQLFEEKETE